MTVRSIRRRTFLGLAGAASVFPGMALGQQEGRRPRVVLLSIPTNQTNLDRIVSMLADAGYVDGTTIVFERFIAPTNSDLPAFAARALASNPDVLMTLGTPPTLAAKTLTSTVPIVFNAGAPVET